MERELIVKELEMAKAVAKIQKDSYDDWIKDSRDLLSKYTNSINKKLITDDLNLLELKYESLIFIKLKENPELEKYFFKMNARSIVYLTESDDDTSLTWDITISMNVDGVYKTILLNDYIKSLEIFLLLNLED